MKNLRSGSSKSSVSSSSSGFWGCFIDGVCRKGRNIWEEIGEDSEEEEEEEEMENFFLGFWGSFGILKSCEVSRRGECSEEVDEEGEEVMEN